MTGRTRSRRRGRSRHRGAPAAPAPRGPSPPSAPRCGRRPVRPSRARSSCAYVITYKRTPGACPGCRKTVVATVCVVCPDLTRSHHASSAPAAQARTDSGATRHASHATLKGWPVLMTHTVLGTGHPSIRRRHLTSTGGSRRSPRRSTASFHTHNSLSLAFRNGPSADGWLPGGSWRCIAGSTPSGTRPLVAADTSSQRHWPAVPAPR